MDRGGRDHQPTRGSGSAVLLVDHTTVAGESERLAELSPVFAVLLDRNGQPPAWRRRPTFETLVRLVLEQQVSLASANAAYRRLEARTGGVTPEAFVASTDEQLKGDGFSRQKAGYVRGIAERIIDGSLVPERVGSADDPYAELVAIRGIGPWTASCFLLFALGLPDIWPAGDRALHVSIATNLDRSEVPGSEEAASIAAAWSPHRSTAARMLWHDYLGGRSFVPSDDGGFV